MSDLQLHGEQISGGPATQCNPPTHQHEDELTHQLVWFGDLMKKELKCLVAWRNLTNTGVIKCVCSQERAGLSWTQRVTVVEGASAALQFLHSPPDIRTPLIHGDVKRSASW